MMQVDAEQSEEETKELYKRLNSKAHQLRRLRKAGTNSCSDPANQPSNPAEVTRTTNQLILSEVPVIQPYRKTPTNSRKIYSSTDSEDEQEFLQTQPVNNLAKFHATPAYPVPAEVSEMQPSDHRTGDLTTQPLNSSNQAFASAQSIPSSQSPNNQAEASTLSSNRVDQNSATEPPSAVPTADLSDQEDGDGC